MGTKKLRCGLLLKLHLFFNRLPGKLEPQIPWRKRLISRISIAVLSLCSLWGFCILVTGDLLRQPEGNGQHIEARRDRMTEFSWSIIADRILQEYNGLLGD